MAPISDIERQKFTEIYETYSGKLYGVCLHYVHSPATAEDLLHDSFIVIFSSLENLRDHSRLEPWMYSIVRNIAYKHLRSSGRMPQDNIEDIPEPVMEDTTVHFSEIPLDELLKAVDSLPEQYGKVFRLSVLDGLSHKEIGEILGIAPHSSSSNLARAKKMLRDIISRNWGILLTFILCITAVLTISRQDSVMKGITSEWREIQTIPSERQTIHIAQIGKPAVLENLGYRTSETPEAENVPASMPEGEEVIPRADTTVAMIEIPPAKEELKQTAEATSSDVNTETVTAEKKKVRLGFSGNVGSSISGSTQSPEPDFGQSGGTGIVPPYSDNIGGNNSIKYRHYTPISVNASITCSFADRWMLSTGLRYTYLHSDITDRNGLVKYSQRIHYLGIPVKASLTFWQSKNFDAYVSAGATFEFPLAGSIAGKNMEVPCQWSAGVGIGLQYDITPQIGIYVEPELYRYFDNGSDIDTIRSERPLTLTIPVGIRFTL